MLLALLNVGRVGGMGGGKSALGFQAVQSEQGAQFVLFGVGELRAVALHYLQGGEVGVVVVEFVEDAAEFAVEAAVGGFEIGGAARRLPVEKGQQFLADGRVAVRLLDEAPEAFQASLFVDFLGAAGGEVIEADGFQQAIGVVENPVAAQELAALEEVALQRFAQGVKPAICSSSAMICA